VTVWLGVLAVAAASFAVRVLPFLAVQRFALPARAADALRHAGTGALTALVVLAVVGRPGPGPGTAVVAPAVAVAGLAAWRGWSTTRALLAGGAVYALGLAVVAVL
jgi:branched-subunit amino acid transport protein